MIKIFLDRILTTLSTDCYVSIMSFVFSVYEPAQNVSFTTSPHFLWIVRLQGFTASFICNGKIIYTGRFIIFSVITNIYNKKTKGHTLTEFFTAKGKLKKLFLTTRDIRCVTRGAHTEHL
jgi:hypothetical protein